MPSSSKPFDEPRPAAETGGNPEADLLPSWRKVVLLALGAVVLLLLVYCSPLHQYLSRVQDVSDRIRSYGSLAPLVVMGGVTVLVAIGFPRLLFCLIAGMALGFWSGLLWGQLGTLLGSYVLFLMVRAGGRNWAQRFLARRTRLQNLVQRRGVLGVVLARQLPLPGLVVNLACALLPIRHGDYILGTSIGLLPQAIPCTLIGAGVLQASFKKSIAVIGLAVVISILAWLGLAAVLRRSKA